MSALVIPFSTVPISKGPVSIKALILNIQAQMRYVRDFRNLCCSNSLESPQCLGGGAGGVACETHEKAENATEGKKNQVAKETALRRMY
jgi:hypothetical protein